MRFESMLVTFERHHFEGSLTSTIGIANSMSHAAPPVPDPDRDALFLDFDGTLVDFADDPDAVDVPPELVTTLSSLARPFDGALALVSGRAVSSVDRLLSLNLPVAGVHGFEFRNGEVIESNADEEALLVAARTYIHETIGATDSIRVEDKGGALVLHFRTVSEAADRARAIAEVRSRAITKAGAILRFLQSPGFAGRRPNFVGDDETDEDSFRAVSQVGGFGIKVGPGETTARYRLSDVAAVREWLCGILRKTERRREPAAGRNREEHAGVTPADGRKMEASK